MTQFFKTVASGHSLSEKEMTEAISFIMGGTASNSDVRPFLEQLSRRGETVDEIIGAAKALRAKSVKITTPPGTIDCCGTGGDKSNTYNVSTAVSFVVAACGVPVAKHGNRASSSKCGAADVLEALGVNLNLTKDALEEALVKFHFAFLLASRHHPAMKHVAVARKKLNMPTIFNLIGPLCNPGTVKFQLLGVYDRKWLLPMAEALKALGSEKAWVVHSSDGLDEISLAGETYVAQLDNGAIHEHIITPEDFGLPRQSIKDTGGMVLENVSALRSVLEGHKGAYRDIVLANAAAALSIRGVAKSLTEGVARAAAAIDDGLALQTLKDYIVFSREDRNFEQEE
jgi:anthranilate phosphoribosyltransferase